MIQIWHNPRCSKSRNAKEILEKYQSSYKIFEYLKENISTDDIKSLMKLLNIQDVRQMLRSKEDEYKQNDLDDMLLSQEEIIQIVLKNPKLIERPIVIKDGKAIIARPPELVNSLF